MNKGFAALLIAGGTMGGFAAIAAATTNPVSHALRWRLYRQHAATAAAYSDAKYFSKAIDEYDIMARLLPDNPEPYLLRGVADQSLSARTQSAADYTKGIALARSYHDPNAGPSKTAILYFDRANIYVAAHKYADAVADINAAIAVEPNMQDARLIRAKANISLKRNEEAIADCDWEIAHGSAQIISCYQTRGDAHEAMGQYDRAADDLKQATDLYPFDGALWTNRGWFEYKAGRIDAAIASDLQAIRYSCPSGACPAFNLGLCYVMKNDEARARAAYSFAARQRNDGSLLGARQDVADELKEHPSNTLLHKAQEWLTSLG